MRPQEDTDDPSVNTDPEKNIGYGMSSSYLSRMGDKREKLEYKGTGLRELITEETWKSVAASNEEARKSIKLSRLPDKTQKTRDEWNSYFDGLSSK